MRLTTKLVQSAALPPGKTTVQISDDVQRGLVLQVNQNSKTWAVRTTIRGQRAFWRIGVWPSMTLAEAREAAALAMARVWRGEDPRVPVTNTIGEAWALYWTDRAGQLRHPAHDLSKWERLIAPVLAPLPLAAVTKADFARVQDHWRAHGQTAGQAGLLRILRHFEGWLLDRDLIDRPFVPRRVVVPKGGTHPVPSLDDVRALWGSLDVVPKDGNARRAHARRAAQMRLLILTGARMAMIQGLRWSEVDLVSGTLSWPADRMKAGRAFRQPLSAPAASVLAAWPRSNGTVFGVGDRPAQMDLSRTTAPFGFPPHSLRKALATWMGDEGFDDALIGLVLAHTPQGATAVYAKSDRLEERREALELWAAAVVG